MVCTHDPEPELLEGVRRLGIEDIDVFMPAAIDMFTEEVGVSDCGWTWSRLPGTSGSRFQGRVYGRIDHGETIFKAKLGQLAGECATARRGSPTTSRQWTVDQCPVGCSQNRPRRTCAANQPVRQQS